MVGLNFVGAQALHRVEVDAFLLTLRGAVLRAHAVGKADNGVIVGLRNSVTLVVSAAKTSHSELSLDGLLGRARQLLLGCEMLLALDDTVVLVVSVGLEPKSESLHGRPLELLTLFIGAWDVLPKLFTLGRGAAQSVDSLCICGLLAGKFGPVPKARLLVHEQL